MADLDPGTIKTLGPIAAGLAGLWLRVEWAVRANRKDISAVKEQTTRDRDEMREGIKEMGQDVKAILLSQATLTERDREIRDLLRELKSQR